MALSWFEKARPLFLAPMAGVTDKVFRALCKEQGADVMVTEFVSAEGILHRNDRTRRYVDFDDAQRPVGVQLFGANPTAMAEGAKAVVDWVQPDFIDLNFGCPVNKVVAKNGGSSLLRTCPLLAAVAEAVVQAVQPLPVTGKIRIGWDQNSVNAVEVAKILQDVGVQAVTVHGRTRAQGYSGLADWDVIAQVAAAVAIPVVGNGDIASVQDAMRAFSTTKVSGIMIGRAAMSRPWLFRQIQAAVAGQVVPDEPSARERWQWMLRHARLAVEYRGGDERTVMTSLRSRLMAYVRGEPGSRVLRQRLAQVSSLAELEEIAFLDGCTQHEELAVA
ncbi:MAG: tRNA dihydrouridine synthase DusB [Verrucomicrobiales bacterium]